LKRGEGEGVPGRGQGEAGKIEGEEGRQGGLRWGGAGRWAEVGR
jgi:hypothetical protein